MEIQSRAYIFTKCVANADAVLRIYRNVNNLVRANAVDLSPVQKLIRALENNDLNLSLRLAENCIMSNRNLSSIVAGVTNKQKAQSVFSSQRRANEHLLSAYKMLKNEKMLQPTPKSQLKAGIYEGKTPDMVVFSKSPENKFVALSAKLLKFAVKLNNMNKLIKTNELNYYVRAMVVASEDLKRGYISQAKKSLQDIVLKVSMNNDAVSNDMVETVLGVLNGINKLQRKDRALRYRDGLLESIKNGARKCSELLNKAKYAVQLFAKIHPEFAVTLKYLLASLSIASGIATYGQISDLPSNLKKLNKIAKDGLAKSNSFGANLGYAYSHVSTLLRIAFTAVLSYTSMSLSQAIKLEQQSKETDF